MSLCDHGVLSASSFSWWAGLYSVQRTLTGERYGSFVAPMFWIGHRKEKWHPVTLPYASWLEYILVWD